MLREIFILPVGLEMRKRDGADLFSLTNNKSALFNLVLFKVARCWIFLEGFQVLDRTRNRSVPFDFGFEKETDLSIFVEFSLAGTRRSMGA